MQGDQLQIDIEPLLRFPIRGVDPSVQNDASKHARTVALANQMLLLHKHLRECKTAHDKTLLQRQIAATDKEIDRLVYELYGLTEEEIAIVESSVA